MSQINLDTSFQCPALKSDSASWSEKITGTCLTIPFKLEYGIIHYCLKNKRNQGSSLRLAESKISSVTIVNNQLTTLKWRLTPSPPCHWAVGAAGSGNNGGLQYSASRPPRGRQESALQELRAELSIAGRHSYSGHQICNWNRTNCFTLHIRKEKVSWKIHLLTLLYVWQTISTTMYNGYLITMNLK